MRPFRSLLILSLCFLVLPGCILSKKLVGETPVECSKADYEGTWVDSEGEKTVVEVIDAAAGHIRATKPDSPEEKPANYYFRQVDKHLIANLQSSKDSPYIVLLAEKSADKIVLYIPNTEAFARLIKQNLIKGEAVKDEYGNLAYCNIEGIDEPVLKKILAGDYGDDMFRWKHPGTYTRVKAE